MGWVILALPLLLFAIVVFVAGLHLGSPIPGPFWAVPGIGETIEFANSPIKYFWARLDRGPTLFSHAWCHA